MGNPFVCCVSFDRCGFFVFMLFSSAGAETPDADRFYFFRLGLFGFQIAVWKWSNGD